MLLGKLTRAESPDKTGWMNQILKRIHAHAKSILLLRTTFPTPSNEPLDDNIDLICVPGCPDPFGLFFVGQHLVHVSPFVIP